MTTEVTVPLDRLAKVYRKIRAAEQVLTQEYETKLGELKTQRDAVSHEMKDILRSMNVTSVNTAEGLIVLSKQTRYYTQDWDAFKSFAIKLGVNGLELFEKRIAQKNMAQFLEDNPGTVPPGLNAESEFVIAVRKPK